MSALSASSPLAEFLIRSNLLLMLALLVVVGMRRSGAPAALRHLVWLAALIAVPALPALAALLPPLALPLLPAEPGISGSRPFGQAQTEGPAQGLPLLAAYLLGAFLVLARLPAARWRLRQFWRAAAPAAAVDAAIAPLAGRLGIVRPVAARLGAPNAMPMTWGTLRPKILLPLEFPEWEPERRRIVLLHELGHVARRDSLSRAAGAIVCALCWFHPGVWLAARRLRAEQEHACDELVLRTGTAPRAYARSLVALALALRGEAPSPAAAMARPSELERRVGRIVAGGAARQLSVGMSVFFAAAAAGVAALAAATQLEPAEGVALTDLSLRARSASPAPERSVAEGAPLRAPPAPPLRLTPRPSSAAPAATSSPRPRAEAARAFPSTPLAPAPTEVRPPRAMPPLPVQPAFQPVQPVAVIPVAPARLPAPPHRVEPPA
ncbi:MAG TPA: M56 family metallopeptidase [Allosphingosinicella sp.]